jgi:hypothetical protein
MASMELGKEDGTFAPWQISSLTPSEHCGVEGPAAPQGHIDLLPQKPHHISIQDAALC